MSSAAMLSGYCEAAAKRPKPDPPVEPPMSAREHFLSTDIQSKIRGFSDVRSVASLSRVDRRVHDKHPSAFTLSKSRMLDGLVAMKRWVEEHAGKYTSLSMLLEDTASVTYIDAPSEKTYTDPNEIGYRAEAWAEFLQTAYGWDLAQQQEKVLE